MKHIPGVQIVNTSRRFKLSSSSSIWLSGAKGYSLCLRSLQEVVSVSGISYPESIGKGDIRVTDTCQLC